jgi:hypothetical protein
MSRARQKIERAAQQQGYTVYSAEYEPVTPLEMGDELGGWCVKLYGIGGGSLVMVGGRNAEGVCGEIRRLPLRSLGAMSSPATQDL